MAGRPSIYNLLLAEKICEQIATSSKSMKTICAEIPISVYTVITWLSEGHNNYIDEFAKLYARAKEMQAEFLAEEILDISDDATNDFMTIQKGDESYEVENKEWTSRSKLRVDARKWVAAHLKPKKYGDKVQQEFSGNLNTGVLTPDQFQQLRKELNAKSDPGE